MKFLMIVFLICFCSQASAINYFWCEKSEDCVKAYGGCGRYYSVHRRYKELYEAKAHKSDKVAFCHAPTPGDQEYKLQGQPKCHKMRCRLTLPKTAGSKSSAVAK